MTRLLAIALLIGLALPSPAPARPSLRHAAKLSLVAIHVTRDPALPADAYEGIVPEIVLATKKLAPHLEFLGPAEWTEKLSSAHTDMFVEKCGGNLVDCGAASFLGRLGVSHVLRVSLRSGPREGVLSIAAALFTVGFRQPPRSWTVLAQPDRDHVVTAAGDAVTALLRFRRTVGVLPSAQKAVPEHWPPPWVHRKTCWTEEAEDGTVAYAVGTGTSEEPARERALDRLVACVSLPEFPLIEVVALWTDPHGRVYRLARWQPSPFAAAWSPSAERFERRRQRVGQVDLETLDLRDGARRPSWVGEPGKEKERVWQSGAVSFAVGRARGDPARIGAAVRAASRRATGLLMTEGAAGEVVFLDFSLVGLDAWVLVGAGPTQDEEL